MLLGLLAGPATAQADLASLKASCRTADALDGRRSNAVLIPYRFCDDGLPAVGGRTPNEGARRAVPVPQRYADYPGLPRRVSPDPDAGADSKGFIALDANVALPDPRRHPRPRGGYPLIVLLHGGGGSKSDWHGKIDARGEKWHYTDAWFAARGYVALTYTSRGFVNAGGRGSTGEAQFGHRAYEVNDLQYLAGLLAEDPFFGVNPQRIVVSGASYGGGVAWLAMTDATWRSPRKRIDMRLAAAAPKYGWTDLTHSLVPNGQYRRDQISSPDPNLAVSRNPVGAPKRSLLEELSTAATWSPEIEEAFTCLTATTPVAANPLCGGVLPLFSSFIEERSAYFQVRFLGRIAEAEDNWVPVFSAGSFSDQLYPLEEHRRMGDLLRSVSADYPVKEYYGDFGDHTQNKGKEWADLCGDDSHPCVVDNYKRGFNQSPRRFKRFGVTTRLNRFIDHYARPPGNDRQPRPNFDVTAALQTCSHNASQAWPLNQPGERFSALTLGEFAPNRWTVELGGSQLTTTDVEPNPHATESDPVVNTECASHVTPAGAGVATYDSDALEGDLTMIGQTRLTAMVTGAAPGVQLNARLYDVFPDGHQVLVDRGVHTLAGDADTVDIDLHGNGWRFPEGHRVRVELAQDDDPYVRRRDDAADLTVTHVTLSMPIREIAPGEPGESGPDVTLRVVPGSGGSFQLTVRSVTGERTAIEEYEFFVGTSPGFDVDTTTGYEPIAGEEGSFQRSFTGTPGTVYSFAARGIDDRSVEGPLFFRSALAR
ncbi:MAG: S15 peptidase family protein [Thermoleophilaceae bacterium]